MSKELVQLVEEQARLWSDVKPPNAASHQFAQGFAGVIKGFEALRGDMAFEDEPSSFEAALQETKEKQS